MLDVNDLSCTMFGYSRETLIGLSIEALSHGSAPYIPGRSGRTGAKGNRGRKAGFRVAVQTPGTVIYSGLKSPCMLLRLQAKQRVIALQLETSPNASGLKSQLFQAQKMESIGRLAGGVAHDFNNLLTAISGNTELALMEPELKPDVTANLEVVVKAAANAADLTKQLLAFSRKQIIEPRIIDLGSQIKSMEKMLGRLIGEDIKLKTFVQPGTHRVKVDPGQLHQIVMNLAVNARDAMPDGGAFTFEISSEILDKDYCQHHSYVIPGEYILMAATDTGSGMSEEVKEHLFEPFFTTKSLGKGTGLGIVNCLWRRQTE